MKRLTTVCVLLAASTLMPLQAQADSRHPGPFAPTTPQIGVSYSSAVSGLLTFRGNASRTFMGTGPVGAKASVSWKYPRRAMCGKSSEYGDVRTWCGTGWVGQPAVFERMGRTWVVFGAYDYSIHFVDAESGQDIIPPFPTGDLAKGTVSVDPDGYPIVYAGSRDNHLRAIAFDGSKARELWSINARSTSERLWNDDWDASPLVLNGYLVATSENSRLYVARLNRGYDKSGSVTLNPSVVWSTPGWDQELLHDVGDKRVSAESSPTVVGDVVYFANSGGLLQGWDISSLRTGVGTPKRVLRFWTGDDTDATVVADRDGYLYVGVEVDRNTARGKAVGQILKIDPRKPSRPLVWSRDVNCGPDCGVWGTPAIWRDTVVFTTKPGHVLGLDKQTGATEFDLRIGGLTLSSPVIVDDVLVQGDGGGTLRGWRLRDTAPPEALWKVRLGANIESTPAVWRGHIYVGARNGFLFKVSTRAQSPAP